MQALDIQWWTEAGIMELEFFVVMKLPKEFVFIRNNEDAWMFKKVSGSWMIFLKPYVDDILLIRNDINLLTRIRTSLEIVFSWRTWANIALVLSTVIYEYSKCLIMLKPTLHIDMILKLFSMKMPRKDLPRSWWKSVCRNRCSWTQISKSTWIEFHSPGCLDTSCTPKYVKTTRYFQCSKRFWARYQSDQDVDNWTNSEKWNLWKLRYVFRKMEIMKSSL